MLNAQRLPPACTQWVWSWRGAQSVRRCAQQAARKAPHKAQPLKKARRLNRHRRSPAGRLRVPASCMPGVLIAIAFSGAPLSARPLQRPRQLLKRFRRFSAAPELSWRHCHFSEKPAPWNTLPNCLMPPRLFWWRSPSSPPFSSRAGDVQSSCSVSASKAASSASRGSPGFASSSASLSSPRRSNRAGCVRSCTAFNCRIETWV